MQPIIGIVLRSLFYVLAVSLPVFIVPNAFVTIPQAKLSLISVLVGIAAVVWLIESLLAKEVRLPRHILFFVVLLLPLAYITSALTFGWTMSAVVSGLAEQDTVVTAVLLSAVLVLTALANGEHSVRKSITSILIGIAALALFQGLRLLFPDALTLGGALTNATTSLAGVWHDFGILLGLAVIVSGFVFSTQSNPSPVQQAFFGGVAAISFLLLIVVSMQDIWFVLSGILAIQAVYLWFAYAKEPGENQTLSRLITPVLGILFALLAFLLGWFNVWVHDHLPEKLRVVAVEVRPSWEGTLAVGQNSLSTSRTLLFGTGPNTFARNWAQFKPEGVNETLFWNLDFNNGVGVVPTSFVTIGILGVVAWVLIATLFLISAGVALRQEKLFSESQNLTFGIVCAIIFLFAFHVMYAPGLAVSVLLFLFFGVFVAHSAGSKRVTLPLTLESPSRFIGAMCAVLAAIGVLMASITSSFALASDIYLNKSVALYSQDGDVGNSTTIVQKALSLWPSNDRAHRAAVELGILELQQLGQKANTDEAARALLESTLTLTIEHGLKAVSIDRADYQNWLTLAQLYQELAGVGIEGAYEQAQSAYTSARAENPTNPLPIFRLGQLEALKGNTSNAIDLFSEAVSVKKDFAPAYFLRSQLLAQQDRLDEAVASAVPAVQLVPDDPLGWYNLGVILYLKGSFNEAGAAFAQAVNIRADYSNALFMLGLTYYRVGALEQSMAALSQVAQLNPNETSVRTMIENIQTGKAPFDGLAQQ